MIFLRKDAELALNRDYPDILRVDNGTEFRSSDFKQWANKHSIFIHYIQPGKPAQNGFIERFNRTYREDVLDRHIFNNLQEVNEITQQCLVMYNQDRPHDALMGMSPMEFAKWRDNNKQPKQAEISIYNQY
ncbi:MAG: hypothetical protein Tsb005_20260 [Gammaproteobacteria bacterium]